MFVKMAVPVVVGSTVFKFVVGEGGKRVGDGRIMSGAKLVS